MANKMKEPMEKGKGWKPIPLSLKILAAVFIFWSAMTLVTIKFAFNVGYPVFGIMFDGVLGLVIAFLLVFLAPLIFVYALWNRYSWGAKFALTYIGFFIVNNAVTLALLQEQFGLPQILFPLIANIIFFIVIYRTRSYFK
jgi:hypothetical protein